MGPLISGKSRLVKYDNLARKKSSWDLVRLVRVESLPPQPNHTSGKCYRPLTCGVLPMLFIVIFIYSLEIQHSNLKKMMVSERIFFPRDLFAGFMFYTAETQHGNLKNQPIEIRKIIFSPNLIGGPHSWTSQARL